MDGITEDMWTPYKHLYSVFQASVSNGSGFTADLEQCLKKYKPNFTNLLRNPARSEKSRNLLRNALNEGVPLQGHSRKVMISQDLADEAVILSDMFDLDEVFAVELLCTAQRQQKHHPGLSRGLVAVLLYYDGRKAISCTLRDMFQVVSGVSWNTELPKEITGLVTNYAESLVDGSNILGRLLELLDEMDVDKEFAMLTTNRAFGSKKHQNQVLGLYEDIQQALAMALFHWSAQRGLPRHIAIRLLRQLASRRNHDAGGIMDDVTLIMLMALLYSYDTSILLVAEDMNEHTDRLPIFSDHKFAECFLEELYAQGSWQPPRLNAIIAYSFGLTLASLRHAPAQLQATTISTINRDEMLIDEALGAQVFVFLHSLLLEKDMVYSSEFFYRRVHLLITDFIDFMNSKVTELRGRADESSHTIISFLNEGLEPPPNLDTNFELLMLCVAKMHGDPRVTIRLCDEYWGPGEPTNCTAYKNTSRSVSLFKFVSLASELLPQTLFKSYLKMISGLTRTDFSARCAFNMLRVHQIATGGQYAVSWDHFFTTLGNYYNSMRNDFHTNIGMSGETFYRTRSTPKAITQREAEHLMAVMGIIQAVAEHDEVSRIMICEHPNWQTPQVLLGLVACATPLLLKAEILQTLAALAKSKETARVIWFHLEASQIIPTAPVPRSYGGQCSLLQEMEQIESRSEQYDLSRGILQLLYTLMTTNLPKSFSGGQRTPAYEGYLKSMINSVLLKFYNRSYKVPSEKWQVGALCLKLLYYLLATYRPCAMDFLEKPDEPPYPGFHVMLQLQLKSEMLQLLLSIVEDVRERLDDYNRFQGKELLEECSLYALLILEAALAKQNAFFEAHSTANCPILLMGLNRMLLDLNPRSRNPDHVLNIIKYVTYNSWLPRHALAAIKILASVTQLPNVSTQILSMYGQGSNEKLEIRQGFVECLEMEVCAGRHDDELLDQLALNNHVPYLGFSDELDNEGEVSGERECTTLESPLELQAGEGALESKPASIELQLKEAIIKLFEMNLSQQLPNFVYFLLGVDVLREFMANGRQHLGIEMQSSCVNSVVLLLEKYLDKQRHGDKYCEHTARIVERIYHLFHGLCANRRTTETILRYFRLTCSDFLMRHLRSLPFRQHREDHVLHAMGHLLNCVSIDVKLAAKHGQMTRFNQLCDILLMGNAMERSSHGMSMELGHSLITQTSSSFLAMDALPPGGSISGVGSGAGSAPLGAPSTGVKSLQPSLLQETSQGLHVIRMLDILVLEAGALIQPQLEFFDSHLVTQLLRECEASAEAGANSRANLINVRKLYYTLTDELNMVQSIIASGQRKAISTEIMLLLNHAVNINRVRTQRCATLAFMSAWGQLVQVLFSNMPEAVLPATQRREHIIDIVEKVLIKVQPIQPIIEISVKVSETVLLLLANLRFCCYQAEDQSPEDLAAEESLTNGNGIGIGNDSQVSKLGLGQRPIGQCADGGSGGGRDIGSGGNSSNLRFIVKNIVQWIMISEVKSQQLRINLYSALLNCLRIGKRLRTDEQLEYQETLISRQESARTNSTEQRRGDRLRLKAMAAEVIGAFGEKLIDTICHDAVTGHDVCRMLALACLDMISELQAVSTLCDFVASRGYLKHILESLDQSSPALCAVLQPVPENLRPLYVYESRMAFLTRMANSNVGARLLLAEQALGVLSNMKVYDLQPDVKSSELNRNEPQNFLPSIDERFRSILLPALSLCDAIINSLGPLNNSAALQVLNFLFAHIDMVEAMLRSATPYMDLGHLEQVAVISSLFARASKHDLTVLEDSVKLQLRNRLGRVQQLMIVVFGRFCVSEPTIRRMLQQDQDQQTNPTEDAKRLRVKYFLDIAANVSLYCRNVVTSHSKKSMTSKYLLTTVINDVTLLTGKIASKKLTAILHTILNQLKGSIGHYLSQKSIADNLLQQRASLPNISFGPNGKQSYIELSQRYNEKHSELRQSVFIAEQNLYLLWIHLDFYMRNTIDYANENRNTINESNMDDDGNDVSVLNASQDEILQLKQLLISTFNETFCTQLITASEEYSIKCKGFNASLLRRIKSLVQFAPITANDVTSSFDS